MNLKRPELILLLAASALAVISGGQVNVDPMPFASLFGGLTGEASSPSMSRLLIGLPLVGGLGYLFVRHRVIHFGRALIFIPLTFLIAFMVGSPLLSMFPEQSREAAVSWLLYACAFMLGTAAVGRRNGLWAMMAVISGAATIVAVRGLLEYASVRGIDPGWRIFAGWGNPNSLAGMLVIAIPLTLTLCIKLERVPRLLAVLAGSLQMIALLLSQSKGGFLALGIGLAAALAMLLTWYRRKEIGAAFAPLAIAGLFLALLMATAKSPSGGAPLGRLGSGAEMQEQSSGVRTLLWKSAVALIKETPQGSGAGTFRFLSAKPGLVDQTVYTHQTYLETGVEGGAVAMIALLVSGGAWLWLMLAGSRSQSPEQKLLKAGLISALLAWGADSMVESTLSTFGLGVLVFALLGAGLQSAADGSSPELLPRGMRLGLASLLCGVTLVGAAWFARVEGQKSAVLTALALQDAPGLEAAAGALPRQGESAYLKGLYGAADEKERFDLLKIAADEFPTTKTLRALARSSMELNEQLPADLALKRALQFDPNNLPTLKLRVEMYEKFEEEDKAIAAAREALKAEETPAFQVRALPEVVPTETYEIRLWLAKKTSDRNERIKLLQEALDGFTAYRKLTVPQIVKFEKQGESFLGESIASAQAKLEEAQAAGRELAELYRGKGDEEAAGRTLAAVDALGLDDAGGV